MFAENFVSKQQPSRDEGEASDGSDGAKDPNARDGQGVQAAGENEDADDEKPRNAGLGG